MGLPYSNFKKVRFSTMATQTLSPTANPARLPLQVDGAFCAVSGLLFTLDAEAIRAFTGLELSTPIFLLGLILLTYGIGLWWFTTYRRIERPMVLAVIALNVLWIVGSVLLLEFDPLHFSSKGRWAVLILADVVALLAIWEYIGLRRMKTSA
jgi:hypothetical protein